MLCRVCYVPMENKMEELLSTDYDQMEKELYVLTRDEIENAVIELNNLKNKYSRKGSALLL